MHKHTIFISLLLCQTIFASPWHWPNDPHPVGDMINTKCLELETEKWEVAEVSEQTITREERTTPLRVYVPKAPGQKLPVILLIHGGAWVGGNLDTHDNLARYLCQHAEALVVSVGYLNAPEGKFPYPLEQCYDALLWAAADANKLAVVGDSAGGNMAAALCLMARDRKGPTIGLQVLINPAPDLTGRGTLERQHDDWDVMRWQALHYVNSPAEAHNPYVSPSVANDLSGLPPALVVLAEKDFLFEDGKKYADRLIEAGVPTTLYIQPEVGHLACDGARATKKALPSLEAVIAALRQYYSP